MNWNEVNENLNKEGYTDYVPNAAEKISNKKRKMYMDIKDSFNTINELAVESLDIYSKLVTDKENAARGIEVEKPNENQPNRGDVTKRRFFKFLDVIFKIADVSGFRIVNRLEVQDKKTGRIFK